VSSAERTSVLTHNGRPFPPTTMVISLGVE
jgi:hypothetical protein